MSHMWDAVLFTNHQSPKKDYIPTKWIESGIRMIQSQNVGFRKEPFLEIAYQGAMEMYHRPWDIRVSRRVWSAA